MESDFASRYSTDVPLLVSDNECFKSTDNGYSLMLELRFPDQSRISLTYSYLFFVHLVSSTEIHCHFSTVKVVILGTNLLRLYEEIKQHKVQYIQMTDNLAGIDSSVNVSAILIENPK